MSNTHDNVPDTTFRTFNMQPRAVPCSRRRPRRRHHRALERAGVTAAIFRRPMFLPPIFLPMALSSSFVLFGCHRKKRLLASFVSRKKTKKGEKRKQLILASCPFSVESDNGIRLNGAAYGIT